MAATQSEPGRPPGLRRSAIFRYGLALVAVGAAYGVRSSLDPVLGERSALELFLIAVTFAAWLGGLGPAVLATAVSVLLGAWAFIPPRDVLWITETPDQVETGAFVFAALCIALLIHSLRRAQASAERSHRQAQLENVQRAEAEREVRALAAQNASQRRELEVVLNTAPVAIWVANDRDCRQVVGNRLAQDLFGDRDGNQSLRLRAKGRELTPEERPLVKAAATGLPALREEFEVVRPDGSSVWVLSNAVPLRDDQGDIRGAVSIWADISDLKRAEESVLRLNADLEHRVERRTEELRRALEELSSYAYSIAHDLRAPLRAMSGFTQLLLEETGERMTESGADYAGRIIAGAHRMDELIIDLLRYSRISRDVYPVQDFDPYAVCSEALQRIADELRRRSGEAVVDGPMSPVVGNRDLLREVVHQLLSNAVKFVAAGTTPRIRVRSETAGDRVRLWVEDNGIGIEPEYRERIFGVFQKLARPGESPGTGMGLAIVRRAVERMDGRCGVESEPGRGSRFWVELPKSAGPAPGETPVGAGRSYLKF